MRTAPPLLEVRDLRVEFATRRGVLRALDDVSFDIAAGEVLGVVGESGAGKSLTGAAIIGLLEPPGRIARGSIALSGRRLDTLPADRMRAVRGREIGAIFQDPLTALNPLYSVGRQLVETIRTHLPLTRSQARTRAIELLAETGIPGAAERIDHYPHQFSGGMRQRVVIALALAAQPKLLIADEPTTALDVSIQAQIIALLRRLCREHGTAVMLITHDMGVIAETADRVAVMYAGRIAEIGPVREVMHRPRHPYTRGLMGSIPTIGVQRVRLEQIDGAMPRLDAMPQGCAFHPRCRFAIDRCTRERPEPVAHDEVLVACWRAEATHDPAGIATPGIAPTARREEATASVRDALQGRMDTRDPSRTSTGSPERTASGTAERPGAGPSDRTPHEQASALVRACHLGKSFDVSLPWMNRVLSGAPRQAIRAVDDVSFEIARGETLALVGESGCGKSTVARLLVGLQHASTGRVLVDGHEVIAGANPALHRRLQMIFQDPYASLNPRWDVARIVSEPIRTHDPGCTEAQRADRVAQLLEQVGLSPADAHKFPHQFSGGQRQRISIARALASAPEFIVCDEPTSALDVSVQAQVLNLMRDLQRDAGLTYLFISHNLAVIHHVSDRIGVMYLGCLVELATKEDLFARPLHPYTRMLLDAIPDLQMSERTRIPVASEVPNPLSPPGGCTFHPRCPHAQARCHHERPKRRTLPNGREVACHAVEEDRLPEHGGAVAQSR